MSATVPGANLTRTAVRITARGIAHRYAPGRGLEAVDFSVAGPGVVAITGPNGAGKSTLLRLIAGLLAVTRGTLEFEVGGVAIPSRSRRTQVGFASPDLSFYEALSVAENLRFAAESRDGDPGTNVSSALAEVGLEGREHDRFAELSSGLKQRVRLAFAILHRPPVLLLDEPGSHLDDRGRDVVAHLMEHQRRVGLVLVATNDQRELSLADQRIELRGFGLGHSA